MPHQTSTGTILASSLSSRGPASRSTPARLPTVFLSYSRKDQAFAHGLLERLEATARVKVTIDTKEILPSEQWKKRLESLILSADKVVFILSPNSAASEVCHWEA